MIEFWDLFYYLEPLHVDKFLRLTIACWQILKIYYLDKSHVNSISVNHSLWIDLNLIEILLPANNLHLSSSIRYI